LNINIANSPFKLKGENFSPFKLKGEDSSPFKLKGDDSSPFKLKGEDSSPFKLKGEDADSFLCGIVFTRNHIRRIALGEDSRIYFNFF